MLRDPVERVLSAYYHEERQVRKEGLLEHADVSSISAFAKDTSLEAQKYGGQNHMVHQLAGTLQRCNLYPERQRLSARADEQKLLNAAKKNLAKYDHVLIYED